jgi:hypothetical protein
MAIKLEKAQGEETLRINNETVVVPSGVSSGSSVKSTCYVAYVLRLQPTPTTTVGRDTWESSVRVRTINPQIQAVTNAKSSFPSPI